MFCSGAPTRNILRTQESIVSVKTVELPCGGIKGSLVITWTSLFGLKNNDVTTLHEIPISRYINIKNRYNKNKITLQGIDLKSGYQYNITGTASLTGYEGVEKSTSVFVNVLYSPLVAVITPPGTRTVGMDDIVVLDGSASYDPDQDGTMGYTWSCSNCPSSVASLLASGTAGHGGLSSTGTSTITIGKGMLPQGTTYEFALAVSTIDSNRSSSVAVNTGIEVQAGDPPDVSVKSPPNKYPNTNEVMVIEAEVYSCCKLADFNCQEYTAVWSAKGLLEGGLTAPLSDVSVFYCSCTVLNNIASVHRTPLFVWDGSS